MASPTRTGGGAVTLLPTTTIAAAGTAIGGTIPGLGGCTLLHIQQKFAYGSGGTNVTAYVQTSFDEGVTWFDVAASRFTTSAATRIYTISSSASAGTASTTPGDAALTVDSTLQGFIGDRFRVKYISTGTYAGATSLTVTAVAKAG